MDTIIRHQTMCGDTMGRSLGKPFCHDMSSLIHKVGNPRLKKFKFAPTVIGLRLDVMVGRQANSLVRIVPTTKMSPFSSLVRTTPHSAGQPLLESVHDEETASTTDTLDVENAGSEVNGASDGLCELSPKLSSKECLDTDPIPIYDDPRIAYLQTRPSPLSSTNLLRESS